MEKRELVYEGKAKKVFKTDDPDLYIQYFKDDATAFNAQKKGSIFNKGVVNNAISCRLFKLLEEDGILTHFVEKLSDREMLVKAVKIFQIEVVTRNIYAGSLSKRLGVEEGRRLDEPVVELYYKDDDLGDPLINRSHIKALALASGEEVEKLEEQSIRVNAILKDFLVKRDIDLVDMKLEFGVHKGTILLADEISPDTCRFWDTKTKKKLDKDRFRRDLGEIEEAYLEVSNRICG